MRLDIVPTWADWANKADNFDHIFYSLGLCLKKIGTEYLMLRAPLFKCYVECMLSIPQILSEKQWKVQRVAEKLIGILEGELGILIYSIFVFNSS